MSTLVSILLLLPFLAVVMLAVFAAFLRPLQRIPAHEYAQLERASAWWTVCVGAGIVVLALLGLLIMDPRGEQVYIGLAQRLLLVDAYTLWGTALIGAMLAVAALVPAARRSLVPQVLPYDAAILLLAGLALVAFVSLHITVLLICWLGLFAGVLVLWALLFRPGWQWEHMELFVVCVLAAVLGTVGLLGLRTLAHGSDLGVMWSELLTAPARQANGVVLCLAIGWLGPAVYLPWWGWMRRGEEAMVWLPAALVLAVTGVLIFVRVLFFTFSVDGNQVSQLLGTDHLLLIARIMNWMLAWGVLAALIGAFWAAFTLVRKRGDMDFRYLVFTLSGLLLLGVAGGVLGLASSRPELRAAAMTGMLWSVTTWAGILVIWLATKNLLPEMAPRLREERGALFVALWVALAAVVAIPPTAGFHSLHALWGVWRQHGVPPMLIVLALLVTVVCAGWQLPRWVRRHAAEESRPGIGWGVIGPALFAFVLLVFGLLAGPLAPLLALVRRALLQVD